MKRIIAILSLMLIVCSCLFCAVACKKDENDETCKHYFNGWSSYTQATCEKGGEDMRECGQCGFREFRKIAAKGHTLVQCSASQATCETSGHNAYEYCTDCDYTTYTETSPALGHDIIHYDGQEANCLHIGWKPYDKCTRCKYTTYEEIPIEEHDFDSETLVCKECSAKGYTEGLSYTLVADENESHYVVTGIGEATSVSIVIPAKINGIAVTEIAEKAFYNARIRSITIPDSATLIGQGAFNSCYVLESITLPFVGNRAGVTENDTYQYPFGYIFGTDSYRGGTKTEQNYYGSSTTSTTYDYYYIPSTLRSVTITGGNILRGAFRNCSGLTSITISDSVTSIGYEAFDNCSSLTSVTIGSGVTSIGSYAFYGCDRLKYNEYDNAYYLGNDNNPCLALVDTKSTSITSCTINEKTKVICGKAFSNCSSLTSITIPDSVTSIGGYAFDSCSTLTSVYITDLSAWCNIGFGGYTANPLYYAHNLYLNNELVTDLVIPNTVTSIKDYAFNGATCLKSVTIPNSVTSIGSYAFYNCKNLTSITIPDSVTSIGVWAFYDCYKLVEVINKSNLNITKASDDNGYVAYYALKVKTEGTSDIVNVNDYLFYTYNNVNYLLGYVGNDTELVLPDNYNGQKYVINQYAFSGCSSLTNIAIPDGITSIGDYAFSGCSSLKYNEYDNAYYLGNDNNPYVVLVKAKSTSITSCTINDNTKVICGSAFSWCRSLTNVTIPNSVTSIGYRAFYYCNKLVEVINKSGLDITKGSSSNGCVAEYALKVKTEGTSDIVNVNDYLFYTYGNANYLLGYVGNATELVLPDNYNGQNYEIYKYAFYRCDSLTSVTIGNGVTSIDDYAFSNCSSLIGITIPDRVTSIGYDAFYNCDSLTSATIGNGVTSIGGYAFGSCDRLKYNEYDNAYYLGNDNNPCLALVYTKSTSITSCTINENTKVIVGGAFYNCSSLRSITIPDSVTSIGVSAFCYCSSLTSITIPDSVTSIGEGAFKGCSSLERITLPFVGNRAGVTANDTYQYPFGYIFGTSNYTGGTGIWQYYYGDSTTSTTSSHYYIPSTLKSVTITGGNILYGAFQDCSKLTSITIGSGVTSIGFGAFYECSSLTSITIGSGVTSIGKNAFYDCSNLKYNEYDNAYYLGNDNNPYLVLVKAKGTSITSCTINENTKVIAASAFYDCRSLQSVTIPDGVTSIASSAFYNCYKLTSITIPDGVTSIGDSAFYYCYNLTSITIGNGVTTIGEEAFSGCSSLKGVHITDIAAWYNIEFDSAYSNPLYYAHNLYLNDALVTDLVIPDTVTTIKNRAFYGASCLQSITIPASVTSIGNSAFYDCSGLKGVYITDIAAWCNIEFNLNPLLYAHNLYLNNELVTDLIIPDTVTTIKNRAFYGASCLKSVTIPNSVTSIGSSAFRGCSSLTSITLSDSVTTLGDYAFYNCSNLQSATIGSGVTSIGNLAFYDCTALEKVSVHDVTAWFNIEFASVSANPLYYAKKLYQNDSVVTTVQAQSGLKKVNDYAFYNCEKLMVAVLPRSIEAIGQSAFYGCIGLQLVYMDKGITAIGDSAFYGCESLENVTLPDSLVSLGSEAFRNCKKLTSITIPAKVTSIGYGVFHGCDNLVGIIVSSDNESFSCLANVIYNKEKTEIVYVHLNIQGDINIPDSVTSIGNGAFYGCNGITSITIGSGVQSIGKNAFKDCTALKTVTIGSSVQSIGENAFSGCPIEIATIPAIACGFVKNSQLKTVVITSGDSIEKNAFYNCNSLQSITISDTVTSIGSSAFDGCSSLEGVYITDIAAWCNIEFGNYNSNPLSYAHNLYLNKKLVTNLIIPNTVTAIKYNSFGGATCLTSVTIPDSVTSIGRVVFYNCSNLTRITIPKGVTSIGKSTFYNCSSLTSITIPDSVTSIGYDAFYKCSSLTSITIPDSVTSIGEDAFYGCSSLEGVYITDIAAWCNINFVPTYSSYYYGYSNPLSYAHNLYLNNVLVTDLVIPNTVTAIKNYAFEDATCLTSITIPDSVTLIDSYAFYGCSGLTNITIPNSVTSIDYRAFYNCPIETATIPAIACSYIKNSKLKTVIITSGDVIGASAFSGCSGLTSITIPNSVTSIGSSAFSGCSGLTSITIPDSVTSIGSSAFSGCTQFEKVYITDIAAWCGIKFGDALSNPLYYAKNLYQNNLLVTTPVTSIIIPEGTEAVNAYAFYNCVNLSIVVLPQSLKTIGKSAFCGCTALKVFAVENGLTDIGDSAFYGCESLENVTLPDSLVSLGSEAFRNCKKLTSITIPAKVTSIGYGVFHGCDNLVGIIVSNDNENFSCLANVIYNKEKTEIVYVPSSIQGDITIPDSVTSIGNGAFYGCNEITSITIGSGVTAVGENAFKDCTALTTVTIGSGVQSIGENAFSGCSSLESINVSEGNQYYCSVDGILYNKEKTEFILIPKCLKGSVAIPDNITSIGSSAFSGCSGLTSITIPDSVTSIGYAAFSGCSSLESITLPFVGNRAGVTENDTYQYPFGYIFGTSSYEGGTKTEQYYYGYSTTSTTSSTYYIPSTLKSVTITGGNILRGAFYDCESLTSIAIPDSVTSIGSYAFYNCNSLQSITISDTVTSIGYSAFDSCSNLEGVYITDIAAWCNIEFDSYNYKSNPLSYAHNLYLNNELVTDLVIPNTVTAIKNRAFYGATCLKSVTIPESVTSIGYAAFGGCTSLESITLPFVGDRAGVTETDTYQYPFGYIFGTSSYTGGTETKQCYYGSSTTSTTHDYYYIPSTLKSVTITGGNILRGAFYDCSKLTSITIPESVTSVGCEAFYGCRSLQSVIIPDSITSIGERAFYNCYNLTSVTIGNGVTSIGELAFYDCTSLKKVYFTGTAEEWAKVEIGSNNGSLNSATIYYYSAEAPTAEGNYWHYDSAGNAVEWQSV